MALKDLAKEDLARSGLTLKDAELLGIQYISKQQVATLGHTHPSDALLFQYWDPWKAAFQPIKEFHRVRLLVTSGFDAQKSKAQKYSQPPGTLNSIYIPRTLKNKPFDWRSYLDSAEGPLYICEGEKKAAAACKLGIPCIALGGVSVYQAAARGTFSLPLLDQINFRRRQVYVIFDTDTAEGPKPEVSEAAERFLKWLMLQGAVPMLVTLPPDGNNKVGLDDYLLAHTLEEFEQMVATNTTSHDDAIALLRAADQYEYVKAKNVFVGVESNIWYKEKHLDNLLNRKQVSMPTLSKHKDGPRLLPQPTLMSAALLQWPAARRVEDLIYRPGAPTYIEEAGKIYRNSWRGWACEYDPAYGTVYCKLPSPQRQKHIINEFFWAIDNIFGDDPVALKYAHDFFFYPLKYPGAKLRGFILVAAPGAGGEGIGKSFLGHMLATYVYGLLGPRPAHATICSGSALGNRFNASLDSVSFIVADELESHDKKGMYSTIQTLVTENIVTVEKKGFDTFMMENHINFYASTNKLNALPLEEHSTRAMVHIPKNSKRDDKRYKALDKIFKDGEGGPTLLHYARTLYDEGDFQPHLRAPLTEGRKEVARAGRSGAKEWLYDLLQQVDLLSRPVASARELKNLLEHDLLTTIGSLDSLGTHLSNSIARQWNNGAQVSVTKINGERVRERVWVLGDHDRIMNMSKAALEKMLETPFERLKAEKKVAKF